MKPGKRNVDEMLKRGLPSASRDAKEQIEDLGARVLRQLHAVFPDGEVAAEHQNGVFNSDEGVWSDLHGAVKRPRWPRLVAAAAAIAAAVVTLMTLQSSAPGTLETEAGARRVEYGDIVRAEDTAGEVLVLADASRVEIRSGTELRLERAQDGMQIRLNGGAVIVNAAKQRTGHFYVQTKDVSVSVVGTVFLVNAEEEGSRVAVIEGEVHVQQGKAEQTLRRGEQVTTGPVEPQPIVQEIAWSQNAPVHVAQLQQPAPASTVTAVGTVTGMVRTSTGAPAPGARVTAMSATSSTGALRAISRITVTDAVGRYRLEDVLPGNYTIVAGYNGTREISKAAAVSITPGITVSGIDFVLAEASLMFEETSIRPSRAVASAGAGARGQQSNTVAVIKGCTNPPRVDPQQFIAISTTVYNLIAYSTGYGCAYVTSLDLVSGGPGWLRSDLFDIRALLPQGSPQYALRSPELQAMVRAMLEDRFKLSMRRETKERSFYELKMGDGPPKLRPWQEGDKMELNGQPLLSPGQSATTYLGIQWVPDPVAGESFRLVGRNVSTEQLSNWIALAIYRPVVDRTGLTGKFSFDVEYSKDGVARPLLPAAIRDELGLRLEDTRGPYEVFVIDRVEKPAEN